MRASAWARTIVSMDAPRPDNTDLPALAAVGLIALIVLASISIYLMLGAR
jgi:hypothetical protein